MLGLSTTLCSRVASSYSTSSTHSSTSIRPGPPKVVAITRIERAPLRSNPPNDKGLYQGTNSYRLNLSPSAIFQEVLKGSVISIAQSLHQVRTFIHLLSYLGPAALLHSSHGTNCYVRTGIRTRRVTFDRNRQQIIRFLLPLGTVKSPVKTKTALKPLLTQPL